MTLFIEGTNRKWGIGMMYFYGFMWMMALFNWWGALELGIIVLMMDGFIQSLEWIFSSEDVGEAERNKRQFNRFYECVLTVWVMTGKDYIPVCCLLWILTKMFFTIKYYVEKYNLISTENIYAWGGRIKINIFNFKHLLYIRYCVLCFIMFISSVNILFGGWGIKTLFYVFTFMLNGLEFYRAINLPSHY